MQTSLSLQYTARSCFWLLTLTLFVLSTISASALDGTIGIHDPSTVIKCDSRYYVFGTGSGIPFLVSSNGFDWERGGRVFDRIPDSVLQYVPKNNGSNVWAPDIIRLNDQYYLYYAVSSWGSYVSAVGLLTSPTLDPASPDYKWTDHGMVVHSVESQDLNAIDPGACRAPDGTLWLCYGSYHGNIELVQLDPKTGLRIATNSPVSLIANESEASDIIYHEGFYYLFVNHGGCCQGTNSTYNIRVGRAKQITGPYLDRFGDDMLGGGGWLFLAAEGNDIGPGHFGLILEDGVEKFSCHYEGVIGRAGRSILDIRPLLWTQDGWPVAGENLHDGIYQIRSQRTGTILEASTGTNELSVQTARYLSRDHQKWTITAGGSGYYSIRNLADTNALTAMGSTVTLATFTGADNQLWKTDQLVDGARCLVCKSNHLALETKVNGQRENGVHLDSFTNAPAQKWEIVAP